MEKWEEKVIIFQFPQQEHVDREIAKFEADGWELVEQTKGKMEFDSDVVPLLRCLFRRKLQDSDTV